MSFTGPKLVFLSVTLLLTGLLIDKAYGRSQWEIQHPTLPPAQQPDTPGQMPGELHKGVPPQFQASKFDPAQYQPSQAPVQQQISNGFWQGQMPGFVNRLQPGIMLTGVLEDEISSGKNKPGDLFSLNLQDGFVQSGMQVIPKNSKIVGAVTHVVPAKRQRTGHPGSLQVSMQSLVLPDGSHIPFAGFIAVNPNHGYKNPPRKRNLGFDIKDTGHHITGMMNSFTNGIGFVHAKQYRGNDFYMEKGELVPVRLNKTLIIPEHLVRPVEAAIQPGSNFPLPALSPGASGVPGLTGADSSANQFPAAGIPGQSARQAVPGLIDGDPFNAPIGSTAATPLSEMPEPF